MTSKDQESYIEEAMTAHTRKALEALLGAVSGIDGGCSTCIHSFVEEANAGLQKAEINLRFSPVSGWREIENLHIEDVPPEPSDD